MKSQVLQLVLLPMVAAIALLSVACSDTPSSPKATTSNASAKSGDVAVAAPVADQEKLEEEASEKEPAPPGRSVQAQTRRPKPVRRVPQPQPVAEPVRDDSQRYFVQTRDGDALNLRASNSSNSAVIGSLPYGTEVIIHTSDRHGEWAEVNAPGGKQGWVAMRFLSPNAPAPTPAPAPSDEGRGTMSHYYIKMRVSTLDGDNINIRSGPSLEDAVVGVLAPGETVIRMGEVGQWTEVDTGNGTGFVASKYLVED